MPIKIRQALDFRLSNGSSPAVAAVAIHSPSDAWQRRVRRLGVTTRSAVAMPVHIDTQNSS